MLNRDVVDAIGVDPHDRRTERHERIELAARSAGSRRRSRLSTDRVVVDDGLRRIDGPGLCRAPGARRGASGLAVPWSVVVSVVPSPRRGLPRATASFRRRLSTSGDHHRRVSMGGAMTACTRQAADEQATASATRINRGDPG